MQSSNYYRIVSLENVRQNHIVYVDLKNPQPEPVFAPEYKKAARIIRDIIVRNRKEQNEESACCTNCKGRDCSACRFRNASSCRDDCSMKLNRTRFQTAVPFIGDRGTGKTSVMYSILERLRSYENDDTYASELLP